MKPRGRRDRLTIGGIARRKALNILLLVMIIISILYVAGLGGNSKNSPRAEEQLSGSLGVGRLALQALNTGEKRYTAPIRAELERIRDSCAVRAKEANISQEFVLNLAEKVVERFVNRSMQAWLDGDMKRLAILYYVGWPLKEELHLAPYYPRFNATRLFEVACTLNETLNNLDRLVSLASGSPGIGLDDLRGLLEAWRRTTSYSSVVDVDRYGPRYMGIASKGPIAMVNSAFIYTLLEVEKPFRQAVVGGVCRLDSAWLSVGTDDASLAKYREEAEAFISRVIGDPYTYMFFYHFLHRLAENFEAREVVKWYNACASQLGGELKPEDLTYIIFHGWLEFTGMKSLAGGGG